MNRLKWPLIILGVALLLWLFDNYRRESEEKALHEAGKALVRKWAEKLDSRTDDVGVYIHHQGPTEDDPWGHPILVSYSAGGFAETVQVRSSGRDGVPFTDDDIVEERHAVNLKGVGKGIKNNVEETAEKTAKGLIKGAREAFKKKDKE